MDDDCQAGGLGLSLDEARAKYGKDVGACVSQKCKDMGGTPGRLIALMSDDGSAWQADVCARCHCSWWHQMPKTPPTPDVKRITESEFHALRASAQ